MGTTEQQSKEGQCRFHYGTVRVLLDASSKDRDGNQRSTLTVRRSVDSWEAAEALNRSFAIG